MRAWRSFLHSFSSGCRLSAGALRLPGALLRGRDTAAAKIISMDVFGTLVMRTEDNDAAWRESAIRCVAIAREHGIQAHPDPIRLRLAVERQLSDALALAGFDPEFLHQQVFLEMLHALGVGDRASDIAMDLAAWELEYEIAVTRPVKAVVDWVAECARTGERIIAVSDTRYSAEELALLLSRHGIDRIAAIYASADHKANKFSGRLFDRVAQLEKVERGRILHVGDDVFADALSAAQRGLSVRRVNPPVPTRNEALPVAPAIAMTEPAFLMGYETLGPILVAFVRQVINRAQCEGVRHLAFVARDGELALQVARILADAGTGATLARLPSLSYVFLSRRSVACASPDLYHLNDDPVAVDRVIAALRSIRGMGTLMHSFQNYFEVPAEFISCQSERLKLVDGNESDVRRLLSDPLAAAELAGTVAEMRAKLRRYLQQEQILCSDTALVDIGWRGSIMDVLQREAAASGSTLPRGYFLGLWSETRKAMSGSGVGLLCDQRRGRGLREGAAWHSAFVLEAVCRASHGMAVAYANDGDGNVRPICVEVGATRDAERESGKVQNLVREGVLAYARWFAASDRTAVSEASLRREAQRRLFKLAFFPTANQRAIGQSLVYSEPTSDEQALSLIGTPGKGLRSWLAGLRSPWKGGYLYEHGGSGLAALYCLSEGILSRMPIGTKPAIRRMFIRGA